MSELGTPDPNPHPLERARDFLARATLVVSLVVLLAATYSGMQRRAVLQELKELDQALAFWAESTQRATALQGPGLQPPLRGGRERYVEARAVAQLSSLCVDDALEERQLADLSSHFEEQVRRANAAVSAAGVRLPTLLGVQRVGSASAPLLIELGASNPWRSLAPGWCAKGFHALQQPLALLAAQGFAAAFAEAIEPLASSELDAQLRAAMQTPSTPLMRLLSERFSATYLSNLLSGWVYWNAERSWLLDELSREAVLVPDKDHRGYRSAGQVLDAVTGLPELPNPAELPVALAPIEAAARGTPTRYILEAGRSRAREANSREEFLAIVDDERKRLAKRRGPVEDRSEPEANAASWGGLQLPLAVFVTIAVLPALGPYLLYALYAAQVQSLPDGQRRADATAPVRDFWFPRLGSPKDPLARPWPQTVQQALPRLFWLLFHAAPLALAFSASMLGLDPMGALDPARLSLSTDALRLLFAVLLVLSFHTAVWATSGSDEGQARGAGPFQHLATWTAGWWRAAARTLLVLALASVVALPALITLGLWMPLAFQSHAWIFDCALLAALTAVTFCHPGRPSNFAWLAYALLVVGTCLPYLSLALQVFDELASVAD